MLTAVQRSILRRVYEGEPPAGEVAHLESLPEDKLEVVICRLDALDRSLHGLSVEDATKMADLGRARFYQLRKKWLSNRSTRDLTPFDLVATRGAVARGGSRYAEAMAKTLVAATPPYVSAKELAREIVSSSSNEVSYSTALRLVRRARHFAALTPVRLREDYGSRLTIDLCAVDLPIAKGDGTAEAAVAAFVLENSTSYILGYAAGIRSEMLFLQRAAVLAATDQIDRLAIDLQRSEAFAAVRWIVPPGEVPNMSLVVPPAALSRWQVLAAGDRRFGSETVGRLGRRLGGLALLPRSTANGGLSDGSRADRSAVELWQANSVVGYQVERHNLPIERALKGVTEPPLPLVTDGMMRSALQNVGRALDVWADSSS